MTIVSGGSPCGGTQAPPSLAPLCDRVARERFAFVAAEVMRPLIGERDALSDWPRFAESWNDLKLDTYLPDGHHYRRRRHTTFSARAGEDQVKLEPHQPHYQSIDYNPLVGGIERWFEPMHAEIVRGPTMRCVLAFCCRLFGALRPNTNWKIECHQFRIGALRYSRPTDTRRRAPRRRRLRVGAADRSDQHQKRNDHRA